MNEVCKNCGEPREEHGRTGWCLHPMKWHETEDGTTDKESPEGLAHDVFIPSTRVSVPVGFIEAVKKLVYGQGVRSDKVDDIHKRHLRYLLEQMEGGGK
jgi:hypothetical protein